MKKFILIAFILLFIGLAGVVVFVVPIGFHTIVHKLVLAEVEQLKGKINYEVLTRDHHQSTFMLDTTGKDNYKIEIGTLTFLNPLENHVKINVTNSQDIAQNFEFLLFFQLTSKGELRFRIKTEDVDYKGEKGSLIVKGMNIHFGNIGEDDVKIIQEKKTGKDALKLLFNKDVTLKIDEVNLDMQGVQYLTKDIEMVLFNQEDDDKLTILANFKAGEFNGVVENKPIFSKSSKMDFSFGKLNSDKFADFLKNLTDATNPMARNPMFIAMGAMGMIIFPIEVSINAKSEQEDGMIDFKLHALMKNKNFMDPANVEVEIYNKNYQQYLDQLIFSSMANRYATLKAKNYASSEKLEELEKARIAMNKVVLDEISARSDEFFAMLVAEKFLIQDQKFFIADLKYQNKMVALGEKQMELFQFLDLPLYLIDKFFTDANTNKNILDEKFAAAGLVKYQ